MTAPADKATPRPAASGPWRLLRRPNLAIGGAIIFAARRWRTEALLALATIIMLLQLVAGIADHAAARHFEARATAADAPVALQDKWSRYTGGIAELRAEIPAEIRIASVGTAGIE